MDDLINTSWIHYKNKKRYTIVFVGTNPNATMCADIIGYIDSDENCYWRPTREFYNAFTRDDGT